MGCHSMACQRLCPLTCFAVCCCAAAVLPYLHWQCPAGSYCPSGLPSQYDSYEAHTATVIPCPEHMTSDPGAATDAQCFCLPGLGQDCCECKPGSWSKGGSR